MSVAIACCLALAVLVVRFEQPATSLTVGFDSCPGQKNRSSKQFTETVSSRPLFGCYYGEGEGQMGLDTGHLQRLMILP